MREEVKSMLRNVMLYICMVSLRQYFIIIFSRIKLEIKDS